VKPNYFARALGRKGGKARARRLSAGERKRIAGVGGKARAKSIQVARRIAENFRYASAAQGLSGKSNKVTRLKVSRGPLPGIYV